MSTLSKLQLIGEAKQSSKWNIRNKFTDGVTFQILALQAEIDKQDFTPTRQHRIKNEETGEVTNEERPLRVVKWWTETDDGYVVEPRFGNKRLKLSESGSFIKAGKTLKDVMNVFSMLREATNNGELDTVLDKAAAERKRKVDETQTPEATQEAETPKTGKTERNTRGH